MNKILVVEDDAEQRHAICAYLRAHGYEAEGASGADEATDALFDGVYDLIVTDVMMPGTDGFEFAEDVRGFNKDIPILFLTALGDLSDKRRAFSLGGDDYMVKPVDLGELELRIGALLRRAGIAAAKKLTVGSLTLSAEEHTAYLGGKEVPLTVREFNILYKLLSYPRRAFTREQLMDEFWDADTSSGLRTVDVYMARLREKFAECGDFEIRTVHGLGYKAVIK